MTPHDTLRLMTPQDYIHLLQAAVTFLVVLASVAMGILAYGWCPDPKIHKDHPPQRKRKTPTEVGDWVYCEEHNTGRRFCQDVHDNPPDEEEDTNGS